MDARPEAQAADAVRPAPRRARRWRPLVRASAIAGILVAVGAAGYGATVASHPPSRLGANMAGSPARPAQARDRAGPPHITRTFTYQQGTMMFFEIYYSDPGHKAAGFGFVGVNGSDWPERQYSFSSPSSGIVEPGSVAYPLDQQCGTGLEYASYVKAWLYDAKGARSKPVVIYLACTT